MTDYYPLLSRAVAGLEKNTGEARRALYERARTALVEQLRGANPPLSEPEITRERLALEEAVRKVEAEAARQMRFVRPEPPRLDTARAEPRAEPAAPRPPQPPREKSREEAPVRAPVRPAPPERPAPQRPAPPPAPPERPSISSNGIRGFRDVVAEAESLGGATAEASRSAREAYAAVPADVPELDRIEPRLEPEGLRPGPAPTRPRAPQPLEEEPPPLEEEAPRAEPPPRRRAAGPAPRRPSYEQDEQQRASRKGLIAAVLTVLIIAGLGAAAYWQRERISAVFGVVRNVATQTPRDTSQTRPKVEDRIGQPGQQAGRQPQQGRPGTQTPVVAQRVVLYEEDPQNPEGNRYVGSSLWRTETVSPGPGLSPELAVRADVEVPERRLAMTMSIRRNTDQALPASHTIEIMFNLPADFTFGGVANVPGLLMKESEQTRGAPLSGLAVKVTNNFFLVGLSATEGDVQRNIQLLKDRAWFDIPIVYNNGRRAILAVEKGTPGERAFGDAFAAWGK